MVVLQTFEVACASHVTGLCATSRSSQIAHCVQLGIDDIASVAGVPATLPTAMTYDVSNPPPHTAACLTVCPIAVDTNHVRFSGGRYISQAHVLRDGAKRTNRFNRRRSRRVGAATFLKNVLTVCCTTSQSLQCIMAPTTVRRALADQSVSSFASDSTSGVIHCRWVRTVHTHLSHGVMGRPS